jgi:hypothetical protein
MLLSHPKSPRSDPGAQTAHMQVSVGLSGPLAEWQTGERLSYDLRSPYSEAIWAAVFHADPPAQFHIQSPFLLLDCMHLIAVHPTGSDVAPVLRKSKTGGTPWEESRCHQTNSLNLAP